MRCQEFFLTEDAVDDLVELEACVLTYQDISFVEVLEDRFFKAFHGLLAQADHHPVYQFEPPVSTYTTMQQMDSISV